jgi:hypothetical protein
MLINIRLALELSLISIFVLSQLSLSEDITFENSQDFEDWKKSEGSAWSPSYTDFHSGKTSYMSGKILGIGASSVSRRINGPAHVDFWWSTQTVPKTHPDNGNEGSEFVLFQDNNDEPIRRTTSRGWQQETLSLDEDRTYNLTWTINKKENKAGSNAIGWIDDINITYPDTPPIINLIRPSNNETIDLNLAQTGIEFLYNASDDDKVNECAFCMDNECDEKIPYDDGIFKKTINEKGNHMWWVKCCDYNYDYNISDKFNLNVSMPRPQIRILMPKYMCKKDNSKFCIYIWVKSLLNISRSTLRIDTPGCFKAKGLKGTGFLEDVELVGNEYISSLKNSTDYGGLWINYSILSSAESNTPYFINISELNLITSSGDKIVLDPVSRDITIVDYVNREYVKEFENGYDGNIWIDSECKECYKSTVACLKECK